MALQIQPRYPSRIYLLQRGINIIGTQIARDPHTVGTTTRTGTPPSPGLSGTFYRGPIPAGISTSTTSTGTGIITRLRILLAFSREAHRKGARGRKLGNTHKSADQAGLFPIKDSTESRQSGSAAQKDSNGTDSMWPNLSGNSGQPQARTKLCEYCSTHSSSSWTELDSAVATACITVGLKHTQATRRKEKVYNLTVAGGPLLLLPMGFWSTIATPYSGSLLRPSP